MLRALRSSLTAVSLVLAPLPVVAAGPPADQAPEPEPDPALDPVFDQAKQLFDAGVARYTAADYESAIDLWLDAYALVPPTYDNRMIKAELIYNVARAQQKWFDIDKDVKHLRQSREMLNRYIGELDELYGDQAVMEREKVEEQVAAIDQQIAAWEQEQARREAELAERMRPKFDDDADAREARRNKAMIGAGAGLTALGIGGVALLITGIALARGAESTASGLPLEADIPARQDAIARGESGNALILIGTLSGAVLLGAGVPLLGVGAAAERKRKQRRLDAGLDVASITPLWLPGGGAGLAVGGRF